ncbi:unnamed protein product, partial [marine sediment metagenome]
LLVAAEVAQYLHDKCLALGDQVNDLKREISGQGCEIGTLRRNVRALEALLQSLGHGIRSTEIRPQEIIDVTQMADTHMQRLLRNSPGHSGPAPAGLTKAEWLETGTVTNSSTSTVFGPCNFVSFKVKE